MNFSKILLLTWVLLGETVYAGFVIEQIKVEGVQKVPVGTVLNYLPLEIGDHFKEENAPLVIKTLYKSGFFKDVQLLSQGRTLVVKVIERSTLEAIRFSGNKEFSDKNLREILDSLSIKEGRAVNGTSLNQIRVALLEQYRLRGFYAAKVDFDLTEKRPGRQELLIRVEEGEIAKVKQINFQGNKLFKAKELASIMELKTTTLLSWIYGDDRYSLSKLQGDCERIRHHYMDRGYLHARVEIDSVRIRIPGEVGERLWLNLLKLDEVIDLAKVKPSLLPCNPNKTGVALRLTVSEGKLFYFDDFVIKGEFLGKKEEILKAILIKKGEVFSRKSVINSQSAIVEVLGNFGYGAPEININYEEKNDRVKVIFDVHPRHRVYLRRIEFKGNTRTRDEVLRREMRVQEGSLYSVIKINESTRRLANLSGLENLSFQVIPVEDTNNQVDLIYSLKEVSDVSLNLQAGLSDEDNFSFLAGVSLLDNNILGSGKSVGIRANYARSFRTLAFNYYNPYFLIDRIGYGFSVVLSQEDPNKKDDSLSKYRSRSLSIMNSVDVPINDYLQMGMGIGYEYIAERHDQNSNRKIKDFLAKYGEDFKFFKLVWNLSYSKLDRGIFPKKGIFSSLTLENYLSAFEEDLYFSKINWRLGYYIPIYKNLIFKLGAEAGYGKSFSSSAKYPFFKNFYAGGMGSVRGFEPGSISDISDRRNVIGGNVLTLANLNLILPSPWPEVFRPSIFYDVGGVYQNTFLLADLRMSAGIQFEFRSPIGPISLSFSRAVRKHHWDETKSIQFNISGGF